MQKRTDNFHCNNEQKSNQVACIFKNNESLVAALKAGQPEARQVIYDKYAHHVQGVLVRTLGTNAELTDLLHDTFIQIFSGISRLKDAGKLKSWVTRITVNTAIARIRKNTSRKWLVFRAPENIPDMKVNEVDFTEREIVKLVYSLLDTLPVKLRIPITLKMIEKMTFAQVAAACGVSVSTIKRRINKGEEKFLSQANKYRILGEWLSDSPRWSKR